MSKGERVKKGRRKKKKGIRSSKIGMDEMVPDDVMMRSYKTKKEATEMMGWRKQQNKKKKAGAKKWKRLAGQV